MDKTVEIIYGSTYSTSSIMAKRFPYIATALLLGLLVLWIFQGRPEVQEYQTQTLEGSLLPLKVEYLQGPAAEQGRPMLLDFWATWCAPCRETIPHMNRINARYKDEGLGLQVIGITMEDAATVSRFTADFPMHYAIARDAPGYYFQNLQINGIPHLVLINAKGEITWRGHPMQLSDKRIEAVLREYNNNTTSTRPEKS